MKILQLIHKPQSRGAEVFACQLSLHLEKLGHEVKIVSIYDGIANLPFSKVIISIGASQKSSFLDRPAWKRLAKVIRSFNPDVVQANSGDTLKYAVLSKKTFGWKNPLIARNASQVGRYVHSGVQRSVNSYFYQNVDQVISVSKASETDLLRLFPYLKGKTEVIGVGLENHHINPNVLFEPGVKNIIHIGGFSFEKNHFALLRIFKKVIASNPHVHLHLIGDGPLKVQVELKAKEMDLNKKITFYGFKDNPLEYIKAADILVLPSIIEGLPGVLLESMFCKTPVVAFDTGGISEIVNSDTGSLIPLNEENAFANSVLQVLETPSMRQIENAHKMVLNEFMNEKLVLRFLNTYERLSVPVELSLV